MNSPTLPSHLVSNALDRIDLPIHAALARNTGSLSLASVLLAWTDWAVHLAISPGKCLGLAQLAWQQQAQLASYARDCLLNGPASTHCCVVPPAQDKRFMAEEWRQWPFNLLHQSFLLTEKWWAAATHDVWGVDAHHETVVAYIARQLLDLYSPGNQLLGNPVVLKRTLDEHGANLVRGFLHGLDDLERLASHAPPAGTEDYAVGRNLGITPGKVVMRNRLMELIQYTPTTPTVHAEPILITPAWIMKYYILDLSPHNSLVKYLVDHGHTVFCLSWKNPTEADRDLGMDDYLGLGVYAALAAINDIVPERPVHAVGYCLGGTLLAIAAAAMARDGDKRLASLTLFAAQTDFCEPGELGLFIDESQVALLEAQMAQTGYLQAGQMAGAFQMLRSYDLLWSRVVNEYLLGERGSMNDLMAWNADVTRLPATMHSQYLRRLFLNDDLSEGRYPVQGKPIALSDINLPIFMVATATDHVAPWRSVYKLHHLCAAELTFVLTSGGHNAGIVNPPGASKRHYQLQVRLAGGNQIPPDDWLAQANAHEGSWWPAWQDWLATRSGKQVKPPNVGSTDYPCLYDAPGHYVLEK
ncbi:PHA/PHB synthase family protein [Chitinimonas naiadis]